MKMLRKCEILTWCILEYIFSLHIRDVPFLSPKFNSTLLFFPSESMKEYIVQYKEIWIPESRRFLLVEWKILEFFSFRIRISNPSDNDWHLKFTFHWQKFASSTWNPESTASNSESKIWLDSLTWGVGWNARSHLGRFTKHFSHEIWLLKCGGKIGFGGLKGSCLRLWVTRNQFLRNTTVKGYKIKRTTKFKFLPSIKAGLADRLGFSR